MLYFSGNGFVCRECLGLRYVSRNISDVGHLMAHYRRLAWELERRPGRKPKRYWRYVSREEEYCGEYIEALERFGR